VHVATLVSILIVYRRRIATLAAGVLSGRREALLYAAKLALATAPAVAAVLLAGDFVEAQFESPRVAGVCLLVTGAALWTTRRTLPAARLPEPGFAAALWIGCAQAVALLPGISRSGATVTAALALGVSPLAAAEFAFLMGVIAIAGAGVRAVPDLAHVSPGSAGVLALAMLAALAAGVAAITLFVRMLRNASFHRFALYCWAAGGLFLLWLQARG
jgi:undecaprenyl-diphosphatase